MAGKQEYTRRIDSIELILVVGYRREERIRGRGTGGVAAVLGWVVGHEGLNAFEDPGMVEGVVGGDSFPRVPLEAFLRYAVLGYFEQFYKRLLLGRGSLPDVLAARLAQLPSDGQQRFRVGSVREKQFPPHSFLQSANAGSRTWIYSFDGNPFASMMRLS
jgi:hypothetical protein